MTHIMPSPSLACSPLTQRGQAKGAPGPHSSTSTLARSAYCRKESENEWAEGMLPGK